MMSSPSSAANGIPNGPRAYILDDDHQAGILVSRMLNASGFTPTPFSELTPFLEETKAAPPWVIVLDLALGRSDAVAVIRHLKTLNYPGKVLLMSGRDESVLLEVKTIGMSQGLAMLPPLRKPFRVNELKESLSATPAVAAAPDADIAEAPTLDLERALVCGWLELWYQAKIELKSFAVCSAEALVCARHPQHGIVAPVNFLPQASGDALYDPISRFVLRTAMKDWSRYFADLRTPLKLAVNVPLSVFRLESFTRLVCEVTPKDERFPGLVIELTEDEIIHDPKSIREIITQLALHNVSISIDDFGSAFSSHARVRDIPFVELKLDRSFVIGCSSDKSKRLLCASAIDLAHGFGASVCAEGVESKGDLETLIALGCDTAQGYLLAKPEPVENFIAALSSSNRSALVREFDRRQGH